MNSQYNEEVEINLIEFLWKLLAQWKAVIIAMILCGALVGGYKYISDSKAQQTAKKTPQTEENLEATLTEEELQAVDSAVRNKELLESLKEYNSNSPLMQLDAYNEKRVVVSFYINNTSGLDESELNFVANRYMDYIGTVEFADSFSEKLGWKYDSEYVSELLDASSNITQSSNDSESARIAGFYVSVIIPEDKETEGVAEAVTELLKGHTISVEQYASAYTLEEANASERLVVDKDTANLQMTNETNISSKETAQKTLEESLEGNSLALYQMYTGDSKSDDEAANVATNAKAGFSVKYILLGCIMGAFVYAVALFVLCIFRPKVGRIMDIDSYLPGKSAGRLVSNTKKTNILFDSAVVRSLRKDNSKPIEEQKKEIESAINFKKENCDNPTAKVSYLVFEDMDENHRSIVKDIAKDEDLYEIPVGDNSAVYKLIEKVENVVLFIEDDKTTMKQLREVLVLLNESSAEVVAYVNLD